VAVNPVSDGFFETAGIALESGRVFEAADQHRQDAAIVNRAFVRAGPNTGAARGDWSRCHTGKAGQASGRCGCRLRGTARRPRAQYVPFASSTT
jgi:hypothetical protein